MVARSVPEIEKDRVAPLTLAVPLDVRVAVEDPVIVAVAVDTENDVEGVTLIVVPVIEFAVTAPVNDDAPVTPSVPPIVALPLTDSVVAFALLHGEIK